MVAGMDYGAAAVTVLVALVVSVIAPWIMKRQDQVNKERDRDYQDKVLAAQVKAEQDREEAARLLKVNTEKITTALVQDKAQLNRIELNGDGTLTAALKAQLAAVQAQVVLMEKDPDTSPAAVAALEATRANVRSLEETVRVREETTKAAAQAPTAGQPGAEPLQVTVVQPPDSPVPVTSTDPTV